MTKLDTQTLTLRPAAERGKGNSIDWLESYHTFSFADYIDPAHRGFQSLRVINDDIIAPAKGFGFHPHHDMEIITYVLSGSVRHEDSMGNIATVRAGEVQIMSAGTGITHSEVNPSGDTPLHLLQIWIFPNAKDLKPMYQQHTFGEPDAGQLRLIVPPDITDQSLLINQDAKLYDARLSTGQAISYDVAENRHLWIQAIEGELSVNGQALLPGDGLAISDVSLIRAIALQDSKFLLFDLATYK